MKTNLIEESLCKRVLELEIPADKAEEERHKVVGKLRKMAAVPGFRQGKAPVVLLERRFKEAIDQEVIENTVPDAIKTAMEELKVNPVGEPELMEKMYNPGEPIQLKIAFEVMPEVELKDFDGLEVPYEDESFSDEMVEKELDRMRHSRAEMVPVSDRPAQKGDFVLVDYDAHLEGHDEPVHQDNAFMIVDENLSYSLVSMQLEGASTGEEKELEIEFPADYYDRQLAGHKGKLNIKINEIKERKLPELTDELAREMGEFESLEDLRQKITDDIRQGVEDQNRQGLERAVLDQWVKQYDFEVPHSLVDAAFREEAGSTVDQLMKMGMAPDNIRQMDWRKIREGKTEQLEARVREMILLNKIVENDNIEVTDDEVEAEISQIAERAQQPVEEVKKQLIRDENSIDNLKSNLKFRKAVDKLIAAAKVVEPAVEEEITEASAEASSEASDEPAAKNPKKATASKPKSKSGSRKSTTKDDEK